MTTENTLAYADEWGTTFDYEIREHRDAMLANTQKRAEVALEAERLFERFIALSKKAYKEGWRMCGPEILYGRDHFTKMPKRKRGPGFMNSKPVVENRSRSEYSHPRLRSEA